jgi:hypothetical protein
MGLVIPAYEPDSRKLFLKLSRNWYLESPVCQYSFVIAYSDLKADEISIVRIRQTYPDKPLQVGSNAQYVCGFKLFA